MLFLDRGETAAVYLRGVLLVAQHSRAHEGPAEGLDVFAERLDGPCKILGARLHC